MPPAGSGPLDTLTSCGFSVLRAKRRVDKKKSATRTTPTPALRATQQCEKFGGRVQKLVPGATLYTVRSASGYGAPWIRAAAV